MSANMAAPSAAFALLALFGALCAARGALAVGPPYSGGLRTSRTTSHTSRARSRGCRRLHCGRIASAAFSPRPRPWACWCWLACRRAPKEVIHGLLDCQYFDTIPFKWIIDSQWFFGNRKRCRFRKRCRIEKGVFLAIQQNRQNRVSVRRSILLVEIGPPAFHLHAIFS